MLDKEKNDNGYKSFHVDPHSLMQMLLEEETICIINPKEKEPHMELG